MKYITLLALAILTVGCVHSADECHFHDGSQHCHDYPVAAHATTPVVITSGNGGGYNNNIIVIEEEELWCSWEAPFYHEPDYCTFDGETCCTWQASLYGKWETYCYSDYCGWELVLVEEDYYSYQ